MKRRKSGVLDDALFAGDALSVVTAITESPLSVDASKTSRAKRDQKKYAEQYISGFLPILNEWLGITEALRRTSRNIDAAAAILSSAKRRTGPITNYKPRLEPNEEFPWDEEDIAEGLALHSEDATGALIEVFYTSLKSVLFLARNGHGKIRTSAVTALIDHISEGVRSLLKNVACGWMD